MTMEGSQAGLAACVTQPLADPQVVLCGLLNAIEKAV
jgi:hypothetical protein